MKKAVLILGIILIAGFAAINLVKTRLGDIRPAILPPSQNLSQIIENSQAASPDTSDIVQPQTGMAANFPLHLPAGFKIGVFAKNIGSPRDLEISPGGTLLTSIPSAGKVIALPDKNQDGDTDEVKTVLNDLNKPHGLTFNQGKLFVAEETQVVRYVWDENNLTASRDKVLFSLPAGGRHFTRSLVFNQKGQLFVTIGSTCNVCFEKNDWYASVVISDAEGNNPRVYAKGLRNSVFLSINPTTDEVWAGDMGRDFLGDDEPPEEINIIRDGKNYGWPICFGNKIHDTRFDKNQYFRDPCADTEPPIFEYQGHSAPLGLTFINSAQFPTNWQGDILIAYHGSWNRSIPTGYKVVRLKVSDTTVTGAEDFLTGFLQGSEALGRPVDVIFDSQGSLYISDDKAGAVYKVIHS